MNEANLLSRRDALKRAGALVGTAAFATPIVVGVFSTQASAQGCDPTIDSDAVDLLQGTPRKWNTNCQTADGPWGRYNAQKTTATIPGSGGLTAEIRFGFDGTDNYPVHCSFYQFVAPNGWTCSATFAVGDANSADGCVANSWDGEHYSVPGTCVIPGFNGEPDFMPPANAFPVPYCKDLGPPANKDCPSSQFLYLTEWSCCPV